MVKQINVAFDDDEHKKLEDKKGDRSWKEFILTLLDEKEVNKN